MSRNAGDRCQQPVHEEETSRTHLQLSFPKLVSLKCRRQDSDKHLGMTVKGGEPAVSAAQGIQHPSQECCTRKLTLANATPPPCVQLDNGTCSRISVELA
ncbi:hypothetical protein KIL84_014386 [Mauremys mutica]|uniref:Uncharacterized protein n=1 Tax=Mauremys mutica TaxID=74926 RepID=A0A9D3XR86_9SAUR|nr:hypothetical protein KIL84_014386 [Mauremys mutica]